MASLNKKEELSVYLSSSPPPFCPNGRVTDKDAIVQIIDSATRYKKNIRVNTLNLYIYILEVQLGFQS